MLALLLLAVPAEACLFAKDAKPVDWLKWSSALFAADVTDVSSDQGMDNVSLRVLETFKGPPLAESARLQVPIRLWAACRLERPVVGAKVLAALNPNGDALVVTVGEDYLDALRKLRR